MSGVTIKIKGLQKTLDRISIANFKPKIQECFDKFGVNVERDAKLKAPYDEGHLGPAIYQEPIELGVLVGCSVNYASFVEFGTRKFAAAYVASLPPTWQELAQKSRGSIGGTFEELVMRITGWVIRKGIGATLTLSGKASKSKDALAAQHQAAYLIARKIVRDGIVEHPFLYPAVRDNTKGLLDSLKAIKV